MTTASISKLKINPSAVIAQARDYPVAVHSRNKVQAYVIGKSLYDTMLDLIEDKLDRVALQKADFAKGKDFEAVAKELGV